MPFPYHFPPQTPHFDVISSVRALARASLRRVGYDLIHHGSESPVRFASEAREAIRLDARHSQEHASRLGWRLYMTRILPALEIDSVIDVGANTGQFHSAIRDLGHKGPVHSFEPIPELAESLRRAAVQDPGWHIHACALGAETETRVLHILADDALSSLHPPAPEAASVWSVAKTRVMRTVNVPVHRLDSYLCNTESAQKLRSIAKSTSCWEGLKKA